MAIEFYAGSWHHRYSEPSEVYVGLDKSAVQEVVERAAEYWRNEIPNYCDVPHSENDPEEDCTFCNPDIVTGGVYCYDARSLFTAAELADNRRALRDGEVIALDR